MSTFKKGDVVRQKMPAPFEGVVAGFEVDQGTGVVQVRVEQTDGDEVKTRIFAYDQIEAADQAGE